MSKALVIMESPSKVKTVSKFLGDGYKVSASYGHLRDLPKSVMGVDIDGGFIPEYKPIKGKEEMVESLRAEAKKASLVYLATDPDREGEAIAWHLKELLELPDSKAVRVTFNEITKNVVLDSISKPRDLDMDLVNGPAGAAQTRQDCGLSCLRCSGSRLSAVCRRAEFQSAVTRMVVDREQEIKSFIPEEYLLLDAKLCCLNSQKNRRIHCAISTARKRKAGLKSAEDVEKISRRRDRFKRSFHSYLPLKERIKPVPPPLLISPRHFIRRPPAS
jgi:DNA topoisomerase-1